MAIDPDPEKNEDDNLEEEDGLDESANVPKTSGLSQSNKDDLRVCIVIILITVLAIIVTVIKIILFDTKNYPELFGRPVTTTEAPVTTTSSLSSL